MIIRLNDIANNRVALLFVICSFLPRCINTGILLQCFHVSVIAFIVFRFVQLVLTFLVKSNRTYRADFHRRFDIPRKMLRPLSHGLTDQLDSGFKHNYDSLFVLSLFPYQFFHELDSDMCLSHTASNLNLGTQAFVLVFSPRFHSFGYVRNGFNYVVGDSIGYFAVLQFAIYLHHLSQEVADYLLLLLLQVRGLYSLYIAWSDGVVFGRSLFNKKCIGYVFHALVLGRFSFNDILQPPCHSGFMFAVR